jgi:hypothetical protein
MANRPTLQTNSKRRRRPDHWGLRELVAQEAAAPKECLAVRIAAARLFSGTVTRLARGHG